MHSPEDRSEAVNPIRDETLKIKGTAKDTCDAFQRLAVLMDGYRLAAEQIVIADG